LNFYEKKEIENIILNEDILDIFSKDQTHIINYLNNRDINPIFLDFPLYYDAMYSNIVCPIRNSDSLLIGATGRSTKNIYHHHYFGMFTTKCLLGLEHNSNPSVILVEGLSDYLNAKSKINELELPYDVVATLTCSLSDWQAIQIIDNWRTCLIGWDVDKAGKKARPEAIQKLRSITQLLDLEWSYTNESNKLKDIGDFSHQEFFDIFGDK